MHSVKQRVKKAASSSGKVQVHSAKASLRANAKAKQEPKVARRAEGVSGLPCNNDTKLASLLALDEIERATPSDAVQPVERKGKGKGNAVSANDGADAGVPSGRKAVFRPVLSSPFAVNWPVLPEVQISPVFHTLLEILASPLLDDQVRRHAGSADLKADSGKGRKLRALHAKQKQEAKAKAKMAGETSAVSASEKHPGQSSTAVPAAERTSQERRWILTGLNEVTRELEEEIEAWKGQKGDVFPTRPLLRYLFVCKGDVDPPALIAHLPLLVCAVNAVCAPRTSPEKLEGGLHLIPLPAGSEALLARALGLRRCSILALSSSVPSVLLDRIAGLLPTLPLQPLRASWLDIAAEAARSSQRATSDHSPQRNAYLAPHVKHLRTTAPIDPSAAQQERKAVRTDKQKRERDDKKRNAARSRKAKEPSVRLGLLREKFATRKRRAREKREKVVRGQESEGNVDGGVSEEHT